MKKVLILILTIFISISLISCNKGNKKRLSDEPTKLKYTDMDTFVAEWKQAQKEPSNSPLYWADGVSAPQMLVPTLLSENYSLQRIVVSDLNVEYCYLSNEDYTKSEIIRGKASLYVVVHGAMVTWEEMVEEYNDLVFDKDGIAYDAKRNDWILYKEGYHVRIFFPDDALPLSSADELKDYFSFEEITLPEGEYYQKPNHTPKIILFCSIGAGVVAISAVTVVLIVKKREKKATA